MEIIFFIIWTFIVLEVSYNFWYSPKAQVKRLIRGMRKITSNMFKYEKEFGKESNMAEICKEALQNRYNAINQLLSVRHYFNLENDREFIKESREKAKTWRNSNL